jgi:hypothetical protein
MKPLNLFRLGVSLVLGAAAAAFVLPVSLPGAAAAFGAVQILFALNSLRTPSGNRFREAQKTAEGVLRDWRLT